MSQVWPYVVVLGELSVKLALVVMILLRSRSTPAVRLAWLVVIFAVPGVGVAAYLLVGEVRLGQRRRRRYAEIVARIGVQAEVLAAKTLPPAVHVPDDFRQIAHLAEAVGGNQPRGGHALHLYGDSEDFIDALVNDIVAARSHCHLEFYIYLGDATGRRVAAALGDAAARGVTCRLLVDGVGSRAFLRSGLRRHLESRGVRVVEALPASPLRMALARIDLRNHRKIAVIDGRVGFCGSQNIAGRDFALKPRFAPWVDAMVRVEGPAVHDLSVVFVEDWYLDTDESLEETLDVARPTSTEEAVVQIMATGPTADNEALRHLSQLTFHVAREELILTTPYFVPDEATASALRITARRGVEVTLVVPARNDSPLVGAASRSFYEGLLEAGVTIHEYQAGLLHAKTITIDRDLAVVTTANLDRRSFELNFEVSMVVYDDDFASQLRLLQKTYVDDSRPVDPGAWARRRWPRRLVHNTAGMLSPLL